jgi:putative colanic acid biosynthesis acetyltransferase WcaF
MIELRNYKASLDRGVPRWKEACWIITQFLFFALPYPLPSRVRVFLLRCFHARIGRGVVIRSGVRISFPWRLAVGDDTWIGEDVSILSLAQVTIGSNCCLSQRAFLCTGSHRFDKREFDLVTSPIVIEDGVWVAAQVFIAPGVRVGSSSMCVAGSVVLKDVPAQSIVRGNPGVARPFHGATDSRANDGEPG